MYLKIKELASRLKQYIADRERHSILTYKFHESMLSDAVGQRLASGIHHPVTNELIGEGTRITSDMLHDLSGVDKVAIWKPSRKIGRA